MFKFLRRHKELLTISVLLVWPLVSYLSSGHRGRTPNFFDRTVLFASTPVQSLFTWMLEGLAEATSSYLALRGAHEDARVCRVELAEAHAELNALKEAQAENQRLKALLGFVESSVDEEIMARVIGLNPSAQFQSFRINRGEDDGVRVGMPVVTAEGVVGHVVRAVGTSADVLLITDPQSRVGGVVQRSRVRATVTGTGGSRPLSVEYVRREDDLKDGDAIVTAGSDGIFPRGLAVGTVHAPERPNVGMFMRATLTPAVDLNRVEEVLVIPVTMGIPSASADKVVAP